MRGVLPIEAPSSLIDQAVVLLNEATTPDKAEKVISDEIFTYIGRSVSLALLEQGYVSTTRQDIDDSYMVMAHYNFEGADPDYAKFNPFQEIHTDIRSLTMGFSSDPSFASSTLTFKGMDDYIQELHAQERSTNAACRAEMPTLSELGHVGESGVLVFNQVPDSVENEVTVVQANNGQVIAFDERTPHCSPTIPLNTVRAFYGFLL